MILKDLVSQLKTGDLSNASIGLGSDLTSEDNTYDIILPHLNLALIALHTKLHLAEGNLTIIQDSSIFTYYLKKQFAQSNTVSTEPIKYISDIASPYIGDCIKITGMTDSKGDVIALNDLSVKSPIWLNAPNAFKVKLPVTGEQLNITYRATHPILDINTLDPATTEIDIPYYCVELLGYFIASRVYASYPSMVEGVNASTYYRQKYDLAINDISNSGVLSTDIAEFDKAGERGWV